MTSKFVPPKKPKYPGKIEYKTLQKITALKSAGIDLNQLIEAYSNHPDRESLVIRITSGYSPSATIDQQIKLQLTAKQNEKYQEQLAQYKKELDFYYHNVTTSVKNDLLASSDQI